MGRLLLKNLHQLHIGQILSGVGFVLYAVGSALALPDGVMAVGLVIFTLIALWTLLSVIAYPEEQRTEDISYNMIWGQSALTILLGACTFLTIRSMMGS